MWNPFKPKIENSDPGQRSLQLISQKYRNNRWWCFIGSQTVVISHIGRRFSKQICMFVYST